MSRFLMQIRFTSSAWHSLVQNSPDTLASVRTPLKALGGSLLDAFFTEGAYDVLAMAEFPEGVSSDEIAVAFYAGGVIAFMHTSPLLATPQVVPALPAVRGESMKPSTHTRVLAATAS